MMRTVAARLAAAGCPFTRFEHARWEAAVRPYDRIFGQLTQQAARHLVEAALKASSGPAGSPAPGLDCATGPGYVIEEALRRGVPDTDLVGADFSKAMLRQARERLPGRSVEWLEADIQEPLPAAYHGRFAWCTCAFGVLHLARPEAFFAAARAALRPGGTLAFTVWAPLAESPAFQIPYRAIEEHGSADVGLPIGPPFFKYSDPAVSTEALVEAGFERGSVTAETVSMEWTFDRPEDLWEAFFEGTARTGAILEKQEPAARARIEAAMHKAVVEAQASRSSMAPSYVLPQPCLLVTGKVAA